jgi:hypothetical protein
VALTPMLKRLYFESLEKKSEPQVRSELDGGQISPGFAQLSYADIKTVLRLEGVSTPLRRAFDALLEAVAGAGQDQHFDIHFERPPSFE